MRVTICLNDMLLMIFITPAVPAMLGSAAALASMAASMSKPGSDTSSPATPGPNKDHKINDNVIDIFAENMKSRNQ